jgi:mannosyltransferase
MTDSEAGLVPTRHCSIGLTSCILVLLLAFALRLHQVHLDSLWEDEIFTAIQALLPVRDLLRWTAGDVHPPGYYLLVGHMARWGGWDQLLPSTVTDWLWRLPSVLAGTLAVAVTYRLGADWVNHRLGLVGALLLAVSPVAVQYSQEARMHGLFLLGATLSTWILARALVKPGRWGWWLVYGLVTAMNLYTVYLAFAVLAAQGVWVAVETFRCQPSRRNPLPWFRPRLSDFGTRVVPWLLSLALAFVLYLPWWPVVLGMAGKRMATGYMNGPAGHDSSLALGAQAIQSLGPGGGWAAWLFLGLWLAGIVSAGRRRPGLAVFGVLWLFLPLGLPIVFGGPQALHMRNAFILPIYLLFVAQGVSALADSLTKRIEMSRPGSTTHLAPSLPLLACVLLFIISALFLPAYYQRSKPDWRGVGAYLDDRTVPGDVIVTGPLFDTMRYLHYYYHGPAELVTPAMLVESLPGRAPSMRVSGGRVWAVTRFQPAPVSAVRLVVFPGLIISEPAMPIYEPDVLTVAVIDMMQQAVTAAPQWAAQMTAGGVMDPDPYVARAAALLFLGDVYRAAGYPAESIAAYQAMVADHPAVGGYLTLAEAYVATGQMEPAAEAYRQAVAHKPAWQGPGADQAEALATAGRWAEAVTAYQQTVGHQ